MPGDFFRSGIICSSTRKGNSRNCSTKRRPKRCSHSRHRRKRGRSKSRTVCRVRSNGKCRSVRCTRRFPRLPRIRPSMRRARSPRGTRCRYGRGSPRIWRNIPILCRCDSRKASKSRRMPTSCSNSSGSRACCSRWRFPPIPDRGWADPTERWPNSHRRWHR